MQKVPTNPALVVASVLRRDPEMLAAFLQQPDEVFAAAAGNGSLFLVAAALRASGEMDRLPERVRQWLQATTRREQAVELLRKAELQRIFRACVTAGIELLIFKGAALAYTHYPHPHSRPRVDTDVLVRDDARQRTVSVLNSLGYQRQRAVERDAIFTQATYYRVSASGLTHQIDLHWQITNRPIFRDLLTFDELASDAVVVSAIDRSVKTPGVIDSLLLACVHPVAHHHGEWSLIWLYDIWLLGPSLDSSQWSRFRKRAADKRVSMICKHALQRVQETFGPAPWLDDSGMLGLPETTAGREPSARYLAQGISLRDDLALDLSASSGLRARLLLLLAHAFPDARYMRDTYGTSGWINLTGAYVRRMMGAGRKLLTGTAVVPEQRDIETGR